MSASYLTWGYVYGDWKSKWELPCYNRVYVLISHRDYLKIWYSGSRLTYSLCAVAPHFPRQKVLTSAAGLLEGFKTKIHNQQKTLQPPYDDFLSLQLTETTK